MKVERRHSPSRLPDLKTLASKLQTFARHHRALPLLYIEFSAPKRSTGPAARPRSAIYKQATAGALKASIGSILRKGDLVAAGAAGKWFIALLSARKATASRPAFDVDLGVAAERLRRAVHVELARVQKMNAGKDSGQRVTVRCGWNVLEPSRDPLEALRHAVRGAALVARIEERRAMVLASVTHELRTPLTAIIGFAERLRAEPAGKARTARYLDIIIDESRRLHRLTEGLIDIGSWTAGSLRLHPERHALAAIAQAAAGAVAKRAAAKKVRIQISGAAAAFVDEDRCLQIFINLIDNAVRYSPPGARVRVDLKSTGQFCTVEVKDRGPGFPDHVRSAVGSPFGAGADGKVGLGLAIARLLVEAHDGSMSIGHRRRGGMVSVTLPTRKVLG